MPLLRFILVLFWINLVHCGNRWVGGCGAAARHDGTTGLFCLDQLCSRNTGCVCVSALRIQLTPQTLSREKRAGTINSLFFTCQGLHCSAFFVLRRQLWLVYSRQWAGSCDGRPIFPPFFLNTKSQIIDQLPVLIKFYFHGWGWSTLLFHPVNVQRSCGMGVASIIQGNKCLFSTK